jgi:hypothetical protein
VKELLLLIDYPLHLTVRYSHTFVLQFVNEGAAFSRFTTLHSMKILARVAFRASILETPWIVIAKSRALIIDISSIIYLMLRMLLKLRILNVFDLNINRLKKAITLSL